MRAKEGETIEDYMHHTGEFQDKSPAIKIIWGDITEVKADAIVNAANKEMLGGGGVDGAIHRIAGPRLLEECRKIKEEKFPGGVPEGELIVTQAYNLPAKIVIHTVGPKFYCEIPRKCTETLRGCYLKALETAENSPYFCNSIAFPAISTGAFAFPVERSAEIVKNALLSYKSRDIKEIILVLFKSKDYETYKRVFEKREEFNLVK